MFKALRYTFALTAILALTISGAVLIGRAQPIPERVAILHLGDMCALPCWIGITPGKTTLSEAERFFGQVYGYKIAPGGDERGGIILTPPFNAGFRFVDFYTASGAPDSVVSGLDIFTSDIKLGEAFNPFITENYFVDVCVPVVYVNFLVNRYIRFTIPCPVTSKTRRQRIFIEAHIATIFINAEEPKVAAGSDAQFWHGFGTYGYWQNGAQLGP